MEERKALEPTIPEAARQYWWIVLTMALAGVIVGIVLTMFVFNDSKASASILIEDPRSSQVFNTDTAISPERYLASQRAIMESPDLARSVASIQQDGDLSVGEILDSRTIITSPDVDLIGIEFVHSDPQLAVGYVNAYGQAYQDYREVATESAFQAAISGVNASIDSVDQDLAELEAQLDTATSLPGSRTVVAELQRAIDSFLNNPANVDSAGSLAVFLDQVQALGAIRQLDTLDPEVSLLLETREDILERRSQLITIRDQLVTDAALTSTGIVVFSEATEAEPSIGRLRTMLVMGLLGAIVGVSLAYGLALRNRRFGHRSEPEIVLDVPMLAEVPEFVSLSSIPLRDDPASRHAEAFRFAASAIAARLTNLQTQSGSESNSLTVTSALHGEGKTTVALNVALSLATRGKRVLIVDGDFERQTLTRIVTDGEDEVQGVTDLLEGSAYRGEVVIPINLDGGKYVDVLPRGSSDITPADLFASPLVRQLFAGLKTGYDYVIVDGPALLQNSYASYLASQTDAVITVIAHNGLISSQQEVSKRLAVVGADLVGYVYNRAPRRADPRDRRDSSSFIRKQGALSESGSKG